MRVLGLDASTTTVGISVIDYDDDNNKTLVYCNYYKPPKSGDPFSRLSAVRSFIFDLLDEYKPDDVALEDIILFMQGRSSAKTITSLAILNRTVGLAVYNHFGKSPTLLNVRTIRSCLKLDGVTPVKEDMPEVVAKHLKIDFPYRYITRGKLKGQKISVESYDIADGIAVGLAFIEKRKPKSKTLKKKKI